MTFICTSTYITRVYVNVMYITYRLLIGGESGFVGGSQFNLLITGNLSLTLMWVCPTYVRITSKKSPEKIIKEPCVCFHGWKSEETMFAASEGEVWGVEQPGPKPTVWQP